jgi:hypothetical protein
MQEGEVSSKNINKQQKYIGCSPTLILTLSAKTTLFDLYAYKQSLFKFILIEFYFGFSHDNI